MVTLYFSRNDKRGLRKETKLIENQFVFMLGRSTMKVIHQLRHLLEKYRMDKQHLHTIFIELEKVYDRVPIDIL